MTQLEEIKSSIKVIFDYQVIINNKIDVLTDYVEKLLDNAYLNIRVETEEEE